MSWLEAKPLRARVAGGDLLSITSLTADGAELLVPPAELPAPYRVHGRRAGLTLLHPWANRLGDDSYEQAGVRARVPAGDPAITRDSAGLPIHGVALPGAWKLPAEAAGPDRLEVETAFPPHPAFPFPHSLRVVMVLRPDGLHVTTALQARELPVPVCFGWHPYLRPDGARDGWELSLPPRRRLSLDRRGLPDGSGAAEPAEARILEGRDLDDGIGGLAPGAQLAVTGGRFCLRVRLDSGYPVAQVFAPPDADVVSLEPMTSPADALRSGLELRLAAPGEIVSASFTLGVEETRGGG